MLVPLNITGGTYQTRSKTLSNQICRNLWPQSQIIGNEKSRFILEGTPGLKLLVNPSVGGTCRGMIRHKDTLYRVCGTSFYQVGSGGGHTLRSTAGQITGTTRCVLAGVGDFVVIANNGTVWAYDTVTRETTTGTDTDLEQPDAVTGINSQAIYDGNKQRFCTSDVNEPLTINGLNFASAEGKSDDLIRPYAFKQYVYMFGSDSIETWWNSGSGSPPFDRVEGGTVEKGLESLHGVGDDGEVMAFLSTDKRVYTLQGAQLLDITPVGLAQVWNDYTTTNDAIIWFMQLDGHSVLCLTFPTENKTFCWPRGGHWFEWSYGADGGRSIANDYVHVYGKHIVSDYNSDKLYTLDFSTYTDNGAAIIRTRDTAPIHSGLIGAPGRAIEMNYLELELEVGVGDTTTPDPKVSMCYSDDGGRTWSTERFHSIGNAGEYIKTVRWDTFKRIEKNAQRIFRFRTSDPVYTSWHSAQADIEVCV